MENLTNTLNSLADNVGREIEYLNSGGCGVIAAFVGEYLKNVEGISQVRVLNASGVTEHVDITEIRKSIPRGQKDNIDQWYDNAPYGIFNHLLISFCYEGTRYVFDGYEGVMPWNQYKQLTSWCYRSKGSFTIDEIKKLSVDSGKGWNDCFDRNQIPKIRKLAKRYLEDIKL